MPSGGRPGCNSKARGRTSTLPGGSSASAARRRAWPIQHHGQATSAQTSTGSGAAVAMVPRVPAARPRGTPPARAGARIGPGHTPRGARNPRRAERGCRPGGGGSTARVRLLVLATDPVDAAAVREALPGEDLEGAEVLVVSPAVNESPVAFWMSDSDEAIGDARSAAQQTAAALGEAGARTRATTGESEPLLALQDALATYPADRVLLFVREDDAARYREDDVVGEAERRFGVPVSEVRH